MPSGIYDRFKGNLMRGDVDLVNDTIKVALLDASEVSPTVTDTVLATVIPVPGAAPEVIGSGYSNGGATLAGQSVTEATTTYWDADDRDWTSASFSTWACLIYDTTVSDNLICLIDFGGEQKVTSGTFTIQWHGNGIISLAG